MAESYKSVICSIFLGKPNSLSALCYNLLTFRWPASQTAHYPPTLATNDPHRVHTCTHSQARRARTHNLKCIKKYKVCRAHLNVHTPIHKHSYSGCNGLRKGKKGKEKGKREITKRKGRWDETL